MSVAALNMLLLLLGGCSLVASILALVLTRRARRLLRPYFVALAVSFAAYLLPPSIHGRDDFHRHLVVALVASLIVGAVSARRASGPGNLIARLVVCCGAVATPPMLLVGAITAACWGQTDCL